LALSPVISPRPTTMMQMMGSFGSTNSVIVNLVSFILAVLSAFLFSLYLLKSEEKKTGGKSELAILKKALSEDEKNIVEEIEKAKEITQDSLRFRLGWSKAKVSTILTNLDKMGLVQRERIGKTYKVYLQK